MSTRERIWPVPVALVGLGVIPLTAGTLRLTQLADGPAVMPANHRLASLPLPLVVHIAVATTPGVLAADLAGAGWAIHLAVAGWAIRRPTPRRPVSAIGPEQAGAFA